MEPGDQLWLVIEDGGFDGTTFRGAFLSDEDAHRAIEQHLSPPLPGYAFVVVPYTLGTIPSIGPDGLPVQT